MRSILVLKIFFVLVAFSSCKSLSRKKRFLSALWPSSSPPRGGTDRMVYVHLPAEYIEMMHQEMHSRADVPPSDVIAVEPMLKPPEGLANPPKVIMKPIHPQPEVHLQELPLPDIHTTHRFVTPPPDPKATTQKPEVPLYKEQQSLPIKRVSDNSISKPSILTADIADFYHTQEFSDLLNEFKIKVDVKKLPDIQDVMIILGTEDAEDTLRTIREVANTPEGMELITSYLKGGDHQAEEDRYYNIYEDIGAGEIRVSDEDFNKAYVKQFGNEIFQSDDASQYNYSPVENPIYATPAPLSWWQRPLSWFGFYGDVKSTKVEHIKNDGEILGKVIRDPEGLGNVGYAASFLASEGQRDKVPIDPPLKIMGTEESRLISSEPYEEPSTLPTIQMSEEDFDKMVKELRLTPIHPPVTTSTPQPVVIFAPIENEISDELPYESKKVGVELPYEPPKTDEELPLEPLKVDEELPVKTEETPQTSEAPKIEETPQTVETPKNEKEVQTSEAPKLEEETEKFESPITVVEAIEMDIPDPQIPQKVSLSSESFETTRRSFESLSGPVRHSPIESRTGKVFRVNPDEVLKESKSLAADFEDKEIVAAVSDLTEQAMKELEDKN